MSVGLPRGGIARPLAGIVAAVLLGGALVRSGWVLLHEAPAPPAWAPPVEFRVESGEGLADVAGRLELHGLVVSARRFRILARLRGSDREIRAGTYVFFPGAAPTDILDDLVAGRIRLRRLTVPEGWRVDQIAAEAERVLGIPTDRFQEAAASAGRRDALGCPAETLEGYLFPETYLFPDNVTAAEVVGAMVGRFVEVWDSLEGELPDGVDRHAAVTLASIVEAETALPEEKPRIAAVYLNRLARGWRLQADPTVRYGIGRFTGRLYYKHLGVESPYNTYLREGLPPGPIGSPGRASLQAVLAPLSPCEDLYFVASGDGGHVFSRTKAEHDRARRRVRGGS